MSIKRSIKKRTIDKAQKSLMQKLNLIKHEDIKDLKKIEYLFQEILDHIDYEKPLTDNHKYLIINFKRLLIRSLNNYLTKNDILIKNNIQDDSLFEADDENYNSFYYHLNNAIIQPDDWLVSSLSSIINNGFTSDFYHFNQYLNSNEYYKLNEHYTNPDESDYLDCVFSTYLLGGMRGGSCWNNDQPQPFYEDAPNDYNKLNFLTSIIKKFKPDISFIEYQEICKDVQARFDDDRIYDVIDYYGNSYKYHIDFIKIDDLYHVLKKHNFTFKQ